MFVVISCPPVCSCHNLTVFHIFQWYPEVQHFCLGVPIILVGCKGDLRTDKALTKKLWASGQNVVTYIQVSSSTQCTVTVRLVLLLTSITDYENSILTGRRGQEETQRCAVHGVLCQIPGKCWRPIQTSSKASTDGNKSAGQSQRTGFVCFVLMQAHGCDWLTSVYTQTARPDTFPVWFSLQLQFPGIHPFPVTAFPYRGPRELKPIPVGIERGQVTRQIITGRLQSLKYILCVFPCPVLFLYLHANVQTCCLKNEYNLTYHLTCVLFSYGQQQKHLGDFLNRRKLQLHELLTSHRSKTYNTVFTKKKKNHFKEVQWHKQWNISIYSNIHGVE